MLELWVNNLLNNYMKTERDFILCFTSESCTRRRGTEENTLQRLQRSGYAEIRTFTPTHSKLRTSLNFSVRALEHIIRAYI